MSPSSAKFYEKGVMSKIFNKIKGNAAENKAVKYLKKQGYKIVNRNYRCPLGEIDIVAEDNGILVFVEVKYRNSDEFGSGLEAITKTKQNRIITAAKFYLVKNNISNTICRFDCIEVTQEGINHIISAFTR